jgi:hypothetical protein
MRCEPRPGSYAPACGRPKADTSGLRKPDPKFHSHCFVLFQKYSKNANIYNNY